MMNGRCVRLMRFGTAILRYSRKERLDPRFGKSRGFRRSTVEEVKFRETAAATQTDHITAMEETLDLGPGENQGIRSESIENTEFVAGFSRA